MDIVIPIFGAVIGIMLLVDKENTLKKFFKIQRDVLHRDKPFSPAFEKYARFIYLAVVLTGIGLFLYAALDSYLQYH